MSQTQEPTLPPYPATGWPPTALPPQAPPPVGPPPGGQRWPAPRPPRGPRMVLAAVLAGLVLLAAVAGGAFIAGWAARPSAQSRTTTSAPGALLDPGSGAGSGSGASGASGATSAQVAAVAATVSPAVVDINTVLGYENGRAAGTGVVLTADGLVLTNNHVVSGATSISVTDVGNGQTYTAVVVGYDRGQDIAVIKLSGASGLATATIGDSSTVATGDAVVAIGNAGGTGGTPSSVGGAVTGLNKSITAQDASNGTSEQLTGLIEVAADIQSGDSGGPLATVSGQVVGIDTAASTGFTYQQSGGTGYAIPINQAMTIVQRIEAGQASATVHIGQTAFLGISTGSQTGTTSGTSGAAVLGTLSGSPAEQAGLARGDTIVSLGGRTVDTATTLTTLLDGYHPGDRVTIGWTDSAGASHTTTVTLATGPVG